MLDASGVFFFLKLEYNLYHKGNGVINPRIFRPSSAAFHFIHVNCKKNGEPVEKPSEQVREPTTNSIYLTNYQTYFI